MRVWVKILPLIFIHPHIVAYTHCTEAESQYCTLNVGELHQNSNLQIDVARVITMH